MPSKIVIPGSPSEVIEANLLDDDFDKASVANVPWNLTLANAATLALDSAAGEFVTKGQSMKFTSGTSASSEIHRYLPRPAGASRVGLELVFAVMDENPSNFAIYNSFRDGANWIRSKLLHVYSTNVWSYQDSAGVQQTLLTRDTSEATSSLRPHKVLIEIDLLNQVYKKVVIDDQDFESVVRNQALRSSADVAAPFMLDFGIEFTNTATPGVMIIDSARAYYK